MHSPLAKNSRAALTAVLVLTLSLISFSALAETRTYDTLTERELAELDELEEKYFNEIRNEALPMINVFLDTHTILQTFSPQVKIIRQRKREILNEITRYLYSLKLETEFITHYLGWLREDAADYALDAMLKKSRTRH